MNKKTRAKCITNTRPVILFNLDDTIYDNYVTIKAAAKVIGCNNKTIHRALKTSSRVVKGKLIVTDTINKND
jgi:hypothetical protein